MVLNDLGADPIVPSRRRMHMAQAGGPAALVVDDDAQIRRLYGVLLSRLGLRVDTASDGSEGLERLRSKAYAVIISDVRMPRMSGIEFFLRSNGVRAGASKRFIFTTGHIDELEWHEWMLIVDRPCLLKPSDIAAIESAVLRVIYGGGSAGGPP